VRRRIEKNERMGNDLQCGIARENTTVEGLGLGGRRTVVAVEPGTRFAVLKRERPVKY